MSSSSSGPVAPADRRLLKGYGPALLIVAALLSMSLLVPTVAPQQNVSSNASPSSSTGVQAPGTSSSGTTGPSTGTGTSTTTPPPASSVVSGSAAGAGKASTSTGTGTGTGTAAACAGPQVAGDPYSPPCSTFSGSNGGATYRGVTGSQIVISYMNPTDGSKSIDQTIEQYTGSYNSVIFPETYAQMINTLQELVAYFNAHFQFYGRKIVLQAFNGQEDTAGDNQGNVNADSLNVADTIKAFGELNGTSQEYQDALAAQHVTSFGANYLNEQHYQANSPYEWTYAPDCTELAQEVGEVAAKDLVGHPVTWAGTGVTDGSKRSFAVVYPDNAVYQPCGQVISSALSAAAQPASAVISYPLGTDQSSTAQGITQQLINDKISTVLCLCDAVTDLLLSGDLNNQAYQPEWFNAAVSGEETDDIAQVMQQNTWSHVAELTSEVALAGKYGSTIGYFAAKSQDPNGALIVNEVDILYQRLYQLALGIQLAGPNLTPQTFAQGLWSWKGGDGGYGPQSYAYNGTQYYSPIHQFEVQWYDPSMNSAYDGQKGTWVTNGSWYSAAPSPLPVFPNGPQ